MKGGQTRVCSRGNAIWRGCDGATGAIFFRSVRPRSGSAYLLHVHICMSDNTSLQPAVSCVSVCVCLCVKASFLDVIFLLIFLSSQHSHICSLGPAETNTDPPPGSTPLGSVQQSAQWQMSSGRKWGENRSASSWGIRSIRPHCKRGVRGPAG